MGNMAAIAAGPRHSAACRGDGKALATGARGQAEPDVSAWSTIGAVVWWYA